MNNGDKPAYPLEITNTESEIVGSFTSGLTKRERFAMAAMQGDWAAQSADVGEFPNDMDEGLLDERSKMYVRAANSLLKALEGE